MIGMEHDRLSQRKAYDEIERRFRKALEVSDWDFRIDIFEGEPEFVFDTYSPAGEDLRFDGRITSEESAVDEIVSAVEDTWRSYDVDEHVRVWIDSMGENGVPSTVRELLEDAEEIAVMYDELCRLVRRVKED